MKKIKVTDEMYKALVELSNELNSQDNRATAMPYFYQIQTKEQVPTMEGCGVEAWHYDSRLIETDEEIKEAIFEYQEWELNSVTNNKMYNAIAESEKEDILERIGFNKVNYDIIDKYENAFLTEKGCRKHIEANKHHYKKPVDYLAHAFRNPELETVLKFLCELTGGKLHK